MRAVLFVVAFVSVVYLVFWMLFSSGTTTWNQRLTLVIETSHGEVRGSAVTRVTKTESSGSLVLPEARGVRSKVTGEAVFVEVAPGRFLFALLSGSDEEKRDATHWVDLAYQLRDVESHSGAMAKLRSQPNDRPVPLPPEGWPMLVTFDDITKPETVRRVDPADLAAVFGEGVRLKAVTLEITREAVTEGRVEGVLGWLGEYQENQWRLDGERCVACPGNSGNLADLLSAGDFTQRP
jgi:hypothetical protein